MIVGATFGSRGGGSGGTGGESSPGAWEKIYDVTKEGDATNYDIITLAPSENYICVRTVWTISTGKFYGHGMLLLTTSDATAFASDSAHYNNFANSTNSGITVDFPTGGTIRWRCAGSAYRVRFRVYKIN